MWLEEEWLSGYEAEGAVQPRTVSRRMQVAFKVLLLAAVGLNAE